MNPSDPVMITVARGDDIIIDSRSCRVLCNRFDIEYMTINMPFIGIQARED